MATIGVQWGNIPNPWGQAYSVGSSLASDSNTSAINAARTAGYLESLGHTDKLHDAQTDYYGVKTKGENQKIQGHDLLSQGARAESESNATAAGASPAIVKARGDIAAGGGLLSTSFTDASTGANKAAGGTILSTSNDPSEIRRGMLLNGEVPNENTVVGANDTVYKGVEDLKTDNKVREEDAKPKINVVDGAVLQTKNGVTAPTEGSPAAHPNVQIHNDQAVSFDENGNPIARDIQGLKQKTSADKLSAEERQNNAAAAVAKAAKSGDFSQVTEEDALLYSNWLQKNHSKSYEKEGRMASALVIPDGFPAPAAVLERVRSQGGNQPPSSELYPTEVPVRSANLGIQGPEKLNNEQSSAQMFLQINRQVEPRFSKLTPADVPSFATSILNNPDAEIKMRILTNSVTNPKDRQFFQDASAVVNSAIYSASGKGITAGEFGRWWNVLIPMPGATPQEIDQKRQIREAINAGLAGQLPPEHQKMMVDLFKQQGLDLRFDKSQGEGPANPAAPAGGGKVWNVGPDGKVM
jgi:hypothetical protein